MGSSEISYPLLEKKEQLFVNICDHTSQKNPFRFFLDALHLHGAVVVTIYYTPMKSQKLELCLIVFMLVLK